MIIGTAMTERHNECADIHLPVLGQRHFETVVQQERQRHEGRRHDRVQQEYVGIDAQQVRPKRRQQTPALAAHRPRNLGQQAQHQCGNDGQRRRDPEKRGTPKLAAISGPATMAIMNDDPIPTPNTAIDRVRTSGRVASVISAVRVAEIAPAPCSRRPATRP